MKIGILVPSSSSGHQVRGVGYYTSNLITSLKKLPADYKAEVVEITSINDIPQNLDILHFPFFDLFTRSLPLYSRVPIVVTAHDVIPLEYPNIYSPGIKGNINLFFQKMALNRAAAVITDSYASVKAIHQYLNVKHEKIKLIYLAANASLNYSVSQKTKVAVKTKYNLPAEFVLFVGDINWNKNIPLLASVCKKTKIPLVWVGKNAANIEKLDLNHGELAHLKTLDLNSKSILRLGFVCEEDMSAIFSLATCYCQPSIAEGFGLPVLEAMSSGTPVICSNSHSLPEVAGDAAEYFDPYSESDLSRALLTIIKDKNLREVCIKKGYNQARRFTWESTANATYSIYQNVLK